MRIRPALAADVPLLAQLIRELADYERLQAEVTMTEALLERHLFGERPHAEALLAEIGDQVAGFALFFHSFSTFLGRPGLYLEDLYVRPDHRRQGVGRALLAKLAQTAVERDCGRLEWAVLDWNQDAIGFYERLGARPNSEWTTYRLSGQALTGLATM